MPYERDNIAALAPYVPGEQPSWADTAHPVRPTLKLNTNENPYPPADPVLNTIRELPAEALRLYPPPRADAFRQAAAAVHDPTHSLTPDHILATNGGDELLRLLITTTCPPAGMRAGIGATSPTYSLYPVLAAIHPAPLTEIPRDSDTFAPPPAQALAHAWNDAGCSLAFFVNPHAPSGRLESLDYLRTLADQFEGLLVIDEAYVDFAPRHAIPLVQERRKNVVILRSLSKGYALAGLRFGYAIAHPDRITALDKARDSYNTDILSQVAATAALQHRDLAEQSWQAVISERTRLTDALTAAGWRTWPSHSNFILTQPPQPSPAKAKSIYEDLKANDILIRYFNTPGLADKLRISIGTPDQTTQLLTALNI
ncbi:MAG: aminotransferase class I/II-fold pyridoxal phosphate-dependent enzyme [Planctomycetota bacterium]